MFLVLQFVFHFDGFQKSNTASSVRTFVSHSVRASLRSDPVRQSAGEQRPDRLRVRPGLLRFSALSTETHRDRQRRQFASLLDDLVLLLHLRSLAHVRHSDQRQLRQGKFGRLICSCVFIG